MEERAALAVDCRGLAKNFGGVQALRGVDFAIRRGQVHGLVGENGAGKSTLMKILAGVYGPDAGTIRIDGKPTVFSGVDDALARSIVSIHQDINLISTMTVAENLLLNNEPVWAGTGLIRIRAMNDRARRMLAEYEIDVEPGTLVGDLPNDLRKMVQIVKGLTWNPKVLLMDEPSSSLTDREAKVALKLIRSLAARNVGVVFISHYLQEIFEVSDEITVLRDGAVVASGPRSETNLPEVVNQMLGRSLAPDAAPRARSTGRTIFSVSDLTVPGRLRDIGFDLAAGEVLGITGISGSGMSDLAKALIGAEGLKRASGAFTLDGAPIALDHPSDALRRGIVLLPSDRPREGVLGDFSLMDNICLGSLSRFVTGSGLLDGRAMIETAERGIKRLQVRAPSVATMAKNLSGGNQQKVVFAKWLETDPKVFIMEEPTVGIDVGTKFEIRRIINSIADSGVSVILITSELEELVQLCSRVLVMFRGAIVAEIADSQLNRENILQASVSGAWGVS